MTRLKRWWVGDALFHDDDRTWGSGWPWDIDAGALISDAMRGQIAEDRIDHRLPLPLIRLPLVQVRRGPITFVTTPRFKG